MGQWNFGDTGVGLAGSLVDANRVPINFQIVDDANAARSSEQLAGQVSDHGAFEAGGKAHVVHDAHPLALRIERFDIRRDYFDSGLIGGVHGCGGEVVGVAVDDQVQRLRGVPGAEIEFEPVQFCEAGEGQVLQIGDVFTIGLGDRSKNIVALIVPSGGGRARVAAGDHPKFWERRCADESLVGIDLELGGMIDGQQPNLIEVHGFFHRLHESEAEQAVARADAVRIDLQIFVGIGNVAFAGRDPVANYAWTDHVGDEFVLVPVPGEQYGTGSSTAIKFAEAVLFFASKIAFDLRSG